MSSAETGGSLTTPARRGYGQPARACHDDVEEERWARLTGVTGSSG
jgi:hypothetical protein